MCIVVQKHSGISTDNVVQDNWILNDFFNKDLNLDSSYYHIMRG